MLQLRGRKQETTNRITMCFDIDTERMREISMNRVVEYLAVVKLQVSKQADFSQPQLYTSAML